MKFSHKEYNPHKGAMESWWWDEATESFTIKNTFDVTDVIEANKAQQALSLDQRFGNEMMHSVAEIPMCFIMKFQTEHNLDIFSEDPSERMRLRKLLESPEYRFLKTTTKKLWRPT